MTRLLVTGASGLLGSNVIFEAYQSLDVIAVVHRGTVHFDNIQVVRADLTDVDISSSLVKDVRPTWIIHCAADTAIDELESEPDRAFQTNVKMARGIARAASKIGAQFLYVSTDSVFEGSGGPYDESDPPDPMNVYARSKLDGEKGVRDEHEQALIVRTNLFGWSQGAKSSLAEWFYENLKQGKQCPGFTDISFSPVYAPELARIFIRMLREGLSGLYHLPGAECISKYNFGLQLARVFDFDQNLILPAESGRISWNAKRPKCTCLDGSKIKQVLNIELPSVREGLVRFRKDRQIFFEEVRMTHNGEKTDA